MKFDPDRTDELINYLNELFGGRQQNELFRGRQHNEDETEIEVVLLKNRPDRRCLYTNIENVEGNELAKQYHIMMETRRRKCSKDGDDRAVVV